MNRITKRTFAVTILALVLVAGLTFFAVDYARNAGQWVMFAGSPHVYNGANLGRGDVVDRSGTLLLTMGQDRVYADDPLLRCATVHWLGDRKGSISAPALPHYAAQMVGYDEWDGVYQYGEQNNVAQLTISAPAQKAALEALGDLHGTVGVYNYKTGEILCAVTTPNYDPDNIPDIDGDTTGKYEGVYVNRFTRSAYIPGSIYKNVTLAAALENIPDLLDRQFTCAGAFAYGTEKVTCETAHGVQTVQQAFRNSCNCAFAQITDLLGADALNAYVEKAGVAKSLEFDGITTAAGNFSVKNAAPISVAWSGIGQYLDQVNPCVFMTYMGAIAAGGQGVKPYLVERITSGNGVTYQAKTVTGDRLMSQETAQTMQQFLRYNVEQNYGAENFPGLTVCAKTGTAQQGGDKTSNAMFTGFVTDEQYPFAFFVCLEGYGYGRGCIPIAAKVLEACRQSVDIG